MIFGFLRTSRRKRLHEQFATPVPLVPTHCLARQAVVRRQYGIGDADGPVDDVVRRLGGHTGRECDAEADATPLSLANRTQGDRELVPFGTAVRPGASPADRRSSIDMLMQLRD